MKKASPANALLPEAKIKQAADLATGRLVELLKSSKLTVDEISKATRTLSELQKISSKIKPSATPPTPAEQAKKYREIFGMPE